jgi:branched-chain amino acid transport system substrate-binding protein
MSKLSKLNPQRLQCWWFLKAAVLIIALGMFSRLVLAAADVSVGVILPLSGANAQFGINARNGIQLVADQINAAGGIESLGGAKIKLIIADGTSTPATAATVAQRMMSQDNVVAILGAFQSSLTIAISEVTERRGIPMLTMSFADQITGRGYKNIFQVVSKGSVIGKAQFDYTLEIAKAAGEKIDKVAIFYEDTAYGTAQATGLRAAAKAANVQVVLDESYPLGMTDATPLINKLRTSGAQVLFPVSYLNDSLLIIRTMRQQQIHIPAVGGAAGYIIPDFQNGLGEFAENVLSIAPTNWDLAPQLTSKFAERYGYFMTHEAIEHAVMMDILAKAINAKRSTNPADIRDALASMTFSGDWALAMPGQKLKFDSTGLNSETFPVMVQWRGKKPVTVFPKNIAKVEPVWKAK